MIAEDTSGFHIAQDVLSGNATRMRPHKPNGEKEAPHVLAAEYTRHLLPWARRIVSYGRERRTQTNTSLSNRARLG